MTKTRIHLYFMATSETCHQDPTTYLVIDFMFL